MRIHTIHRRQRLDGTPEDVFPFFADAYNLQALTPPLLHFRVLTPRPISMGVGTLIHYRLKLHGVPITWLTSIQSWDEPHGFIDTQLRGPYALWHHIHTFQPTADGRGTVMADTVRYAIGFGPLGDLAHRLFVKRDIEAVMDFRALQIPGLLTEFRAWTATSTTAPV